MTSPDYKIQRSSAQDMDDDDLFWAVVEPMWDDLSFYEEPEQAAKFFASVTPAQGGVIAIWWCRSEVWNGGFDQFFFNSTGMIWPQALDGFRIVGAQAHAALLERALAVFPGGVAPLERGERIDALELNESRMDVLDSADQDFFALERDEEKNLNKVVGKYVRSHGDEFFRD